MEVVPYRLPAPSRTTGEKGYAPSAPPVKLYNTVSVPFGATLNTAPAKEVAP
jgi:hypothetical protein